MSTEAADFSVTLFDEVAELANHIVRMTTELAPRVEHWGEVYVILTYLDQAVAQARHALTHYLPVPLSEGFLQNSSIGPPAAKWAKFTNSDLLLVTKSVVALVRKSAQFYYNETATRPLPGDDSSRAMRGLKDGTLWLETFETKYSAGQFSSDGSTFTKSLVPLQPRLAPSSVHFAQIANRPEGGAWPAVEAISVVVDGERALIASLTASGVTNLAEVDVARAKLAESIRRGASLEALLRPNPRTR